MNPKGNSSLREAGAVGGSLGLSGASLAVAACCAGPWAVALFGMSGAVAMARWEPFRLFLLVPAAALLAWVIWHVWRTPGRRPLLKTALAIAALMLVASFFAADILGRLVQPVS